ncbi:glutathione synthetase-like isoform X1 [Asterias rubens]|uniref:glutathione synthetase-like isoform X1 n=1 Tax=Asterias rubens TaxID=7604 RepID=UPI0014550A73|nr:glutathione synthetase-like isoform X1 [Asterias rubens]XP_033626024.1 glutathione synthetase-like isoform X1 [Asterias rubens]
MTSLPYTLPSLDASTLHYLAECSKNYALMNGVIKRVAGSLDSSEVATYIPHTLFPSPLPRKLYNLANEMQESINELVLRVANDKEFLTTALKSTIAVDDFTAKLFSIFQEVEKEGLKKPITLCVVRPDYMVDTSGPELALKQVEINTIAAGMGGIGTQVADLHRYNVGLCGDMKVELAGNQAVNAIAEGVAEAWRLYGQPSSAWVLFLVSTHEYNVFDQCWLEHTIRKINPAIKVMRKTLAEVGQRGTLTEDRRLLMDGSEIALVYFRIGYAPRQYPTETEWNARILIERSQAVTCPSVNFHLAGTKKIQQELSKPGVLEKYLTDEGAIAKIRSTFVHQYDLGLTEEGDAAAALGIKHPERYVLKPQREGGGNNLYDEDLKSELERLSGQVERGACILMEKIQGQVFQNYDIRHTMEPVINDMVTEFGPFGVILSHGDEVLLNKTTGYYMKSRNVNVQECGISTGGAAMDSVALV